MISPNLRLDEFESVALPLHDALYRTALSLMRNPDQAQDVVQETYLEAWKSFHKFATGTNCKAWMFAILFHKVRHYRRKWLGRWIQPEENVLAETLMARAELPDRVTDQEILTAIAEIPAQFSEVLLAVDVQELAYKEAAEVLGVPIGTVMSRLSRGRALLRERLAGTARSYGIGAREATSACY